MFFLIFFFVICFNNIVGDNLDVNNNSYITFFIDSDFFECTRGKRPLVQNKIIKSDFKGDLNVEGVVYTSKGITTSGVISASYGIKVSSGGANINGELLVNNLSGAKITLGNSLNGKQINLITDSNNDIILDSNSIKIKSSYIGIPRTGVTMPLVIDDQGRVKTLYSTEKMKENIKPLIFFLEDICYLKPYQFNYIRESELSDTIQWGFIAEDLINTPLEEAVIMDSNNKPLNIDDRKIIAFLSVQLQNIYLKMKLMEEKMLAYEEKIKNYEEKIESIENNIFFQL